MLRKLPVFLWLTVFAMLSFGCGGGGNALTNDPTGNDGPKNSQFTFGFPQVVDIIAGQNIIVGTVTITNDATNIYVDYAVNAPWVITETHLALGCTLADIPQKNGNPTPGKFPYKSSSPGGVSTVSFTIPRADYEACGDCVVVAAHCVVGILGNGGISQTQTGWGEGLPFPGKNWAMYIDCFSIQECDPRTILLPGEGELVTDCFSYPGTNSYWDETLSGLPLGLDVSDGLYPGWCVQNNVYLSPGTCPQVELISVYDFGNLPGPAVGIDWERVVYIINHKGTASIGQIQNAIWYFTLGSPPALDPVSQALVDDAIANGAGFLPQAGEKMCVLAWINEVTQLTFIEVEVQCE